MTIPAEDVPSPKFHENETRPAFVQPTCVAQLAEASKLVAMPAFTGVGDTVNLAVGALAGG